MKPKISNTRIYPGEINKVSIFYTSVERHKEHILFRGYDIATKKRIEKEIDFKPELYLYSGDGTKDAVSMKGVPLKRIEFDNPGAMRDFIEQYKTVEGFTMFGMKNPIFQFISRTFKGEIEYDASLVSGGIIDIEVFSGDIDADGNVKPGPFPKAEDAEYPITAITLYSTKTNTYYAYGLEYFKDHYLGTFDVDNIDEKLKDCKIEYKGYKNEYDLIVDFVKMWSELSLDWYSGWNSEDFDITYVVNRMKKITGGASVKMLSPWGLVKARTKRGKFGDVATYDIIGIACLDMKDLYVKHGFIQPPDWKLNTVAKEVLGEEKIGYEEEGSLTTLYVTNYNKYMTYNIRDVDLVVRLNNEKQMSTLTLILAYQTKSNYADTLGTVASWSSLLYDMLNHKGIQTEVKSPQPETESIPGGFVMTPKIGLHRWVMNWDLNSLYPHLMQQYNLGPETILEINELPDEIRNLPNFTLDDLLNKRVDLSVLKKYNLAMSANRQFFRRDKMSCLNEKMREIYGTRSATKKEMLDEEQEYENYKHAPDFNETYARKLVSSISFKDTKQHSLKISMNAAYGALSNRYFTEFYDKRIATAITLSGQLSITWAAKAINAFMNEILGTGSNTVQYVRDGTESNILFKGNGKQYIIYADTDSVYVDFSDLVDQLFSKEEQEDTEKIIDFLDMIANTQFQELINKAYEELADYMNAHEQRMFMKREVIATKAVWHGKKRYAMMMKDKEGVRYEKPKIKIVGLEAIRGNVPERCRNWLKQCYVTALTKDEAALHDEVKSIKKEFLALPVEAIASPKTANNIDQYADRENIYTKGTPKHVRAALYHNYLVNQLGLNVPAVMSGDKVLFVSLKKENRYKFDVMGFSGYMPKEFLLHDKVDYELSFNENFVGYLDTFLKPIGWSPQPRASVMNFFT